jgi:dipeptidase E
MRLFLSSQDFGNYPEALIKLVGKNKKAAFIKNAQDDKSPEERNFSIPEKKDMFQSASFEFEELDLRDYFGERKKLLNKLSNFGLVWCSGGNTFILRRAMAASGLDSILKDLLSKDQIVYGGSSAGSCVTAPSLQGIENGDRPHPDIVPDGYPIKEPIWDGLNIVPFMIVPHYNSDWFKKEADATIQYLEEHKLSYRKLKDGQVIVIDGDKEEFLK